MEKYKFLKDLIHFNTIEDNENKKIINYLECVCKELNFKTEYKGRNLIMTYGENPKLGFLGHTDTVEYIDGWKTDPFKLVKEEDKLYGLGVCDMKGGIAAILDAISQIDLGKLRYGIKLYFTYDEEIGFKGIYDLVENGENFPEVMIFGEPTDNQILVGSKGLLSYELEFIGKKAHSSNPKKGISANVNAIKFMNELMEYYEYNIKILKEDKYEIPYTTMNIGLLNGGSAINSIPAQCKATLDFRIADSQHINLIKEKIAELSNKYKCNIKVLDCIEPFIDNNIMTDNQKTANFITEASFVKDVSRLILGLGPITAHEINEHITEKSYNKLVSQYMEIITKVCK